MTIVGHTRQRQALERLLRRNVLPSTLLFAGPSGVGKKLAAQELARSLFCDRNRTKVENYGGCGACHSCTLFDHSNLPDYYPVECGDKDRWDVDAIRELLHSLSLVAFSAGARVVLFNDAEELHISSSNALLKTLEEPRPNTYFILVTSNASKLPSTILSRSQTWFFNSLEQQDVRKILGKNVDAEIPLDDLVLLADGAPGSITAIKERYSEWREIQKRLSLIFDGDSRDAIKLASELSKDKDTLREKLRLMRIYARSRMHAAPSEGKWAIALSNLITAERLIFDRNLQAALVLNWVFLLLVPDDTLNSFTRYTNSVTLLEQVVV